MTIHIEKVNKKNLNKFINFPYKLYARDPLWIGELKMDTKHMLTKDPFWNHAAKQLFLAYKDGRVAGRIAAIINHTHNETWQEHCGMFGFFDCIDDKAVAAALFTAAKDWLKQRSMKVIRGPFNPSINHPCGLLVEDYSTAPFIMMPYNYPYYESLITAQGFSKVKDLLAFERTKEDRFSPRFEKIIARAAGKQNITLRPIDMKNLQSEALIIRDIFNKSWAQNWGALPLSELEIKDLVRQLKMIVDPNITCVAELDGVPAGFYITIPNMNEVLAILKGTIFNPVRTVRALMAWRKIKTTRLMMLGVLPEFRKRGLDLILIKHIVENGPNKGYYMAELSWLLEDNNAIINVVKESGCREMRRRYRIYEAPL